MCGISCHNNTEFLHAIAEVCLCVMHNKWNSYVYLERDTTVGNFEVRITTFILTMESSLKLPPSESESFAVSLIVSFPINIFCEVFSELTLSPGFSMLLVVPQTSPYYCDHIDM